MKWREGVNEKIRILWYNKGEIFILRNDSGYSRVFFYMRLRVLFRILFIIYWFQKLTNAFVE